LIPELDLTAREGLAVKRLASALEPLGVREAEVVEAWAVAQRADRQARLRRIEQGRALIEEADGRPLLAVIGRPYTLYDRVASLNLLHRIRQQGVQPIPIDFLPLDNIELSEEERRSIWWFGHLLIKALKL